MDLNLLSIFVAVAETSSFSAAAGRLGMPKSSVSRGVAKLEADLGVRLLHRTTRNVALSTAGTALYERTAPLLAAIGESVEELPEREEQPSGKLRITATVDLGVAYLADVITRFALRYPATKVDLELTNATLDLVAEGIDLAFRFGPERLEDSTLTAHPAAVLRSALYASPTYLARRKAIRAPADLDEHDFIVFRRIPTLTLEGPGEPMTIETRGRLTVDDMLVMRAMMERGAGIGILPTFLASDECAGGSLVRVLPRWSTPTGRLWLVTPPGRHVPRKVAAFRDFFVDSLETRPI